MANASSPWNRANVFVSIHVLLASFSSHSSGAFQVAFDGVNYEISNTFRRHYSVYDIPSLSYIEPALLPPHHGGLFRLTVKGPLTFPNLAVRCWYLNPNIGSTAGAEPHAIVRTVRPVAMKHNAIVCHIPQLSSSEAAWLKRWWGLPIVVVVSCRRRKEGWQ